MEQKQARNINRANDELTESARQSFQMLADRTVALQESNLRLTHYFFQNWVQQLQSQTQGNQQAAQTVQQQSDRQQQALQTLTQESTNAYSEFLGSAFSFYEEALRSATQVVQDNLQALQATTQVTQQGVQAASQATETAGQAVQQGALAGAWGVGRIVQAGDQATRKEREPIALEYAGSDRTAAIQLIDELLTEDPGYDQETWPEIAEALDRDRLSDRKLFVD